MRSRAARCWFDSSFRRSARSRRVNSANLKSADLRLRAGAAARERIRGLIARGAASQREMDDAEQEVTLAEGELAVARAAMRASESLGQNTTIRAPFNGTVAERLNNPGDLVGPDDKDPILRLIDPTQVQVTATVEAGDITRFAVGATARAVAEGKAMPELLRVVSRPSPEAGATSVTITLSFDMPTRWRQAPRWASKSTRSNTRTSRWYRQSPC